MIHKQTLDVYEEVFKREVVSFPKSSPNFTDLGIALNQILISICLYVLQENYDV